MNVKTHYVLCQFDTRFLYRDNKDTPADRYYETFWSEKKKDGYYKPDAFWEIPIWITEIDGILEKQEYTSELYIINSEKDFDLSRKYDLENTVFLFSALDVNKQYIKDIARLNQECLFIVGGYIDGTEYFEYLMNIEYVNSIAEYCKIEGLDYSYEVSYRLFRGIECIPRLTMSTGCKHNCKFCNVEKDLKEISYADIIKQVKAMKVLKFKLVYLNDKTFGQCENYRQLKEVRKVMRLCNPKFEGFIVQTTAAKCKDETFCIELRWLGVKIVEIGVETYNDKLLTEYRKPHNTEMIDVSFGNLLSQDIKIIPNIIIGLIGENIQTYRSTIAFLYGAKRYIYGLNIYNLAIYADTDLVKEINTDTGNTNEMQVNKSYHTDLDRQIIEYFYDRVFKL